MNVEEAKMNKALLYEIARKKEQSPVSVHP